jgi:hypothetical protein
MFEVGKLRKKCYIMGNPIDVSKNMFRQGWMKGNVHPLKIPS